MTIDEAVNNLKTKIAGLSAKAVFHVKKISDEEVRMSVYVSPDQVEPIHDAIRDDTVQILVKEGLDVQVFVYNIENDKPPES
ncbi:MAG: hypothetical protein AAB342_01460 [Chloroflexota bacterium]